MTYWQRIELTIEKVKNKLKLKVVSPLIHTEIRAANVLVTLY